MPVGDLTTNVLDAQFVTYAGNVPTNSLFHLVRGAGSTIFAGVFAVSTSSGGTRQIDIGSYSISTAGIITPTIISQVRLSCNAGTFDALGSLTPGVVVVAWRDAGDSFSPKVSTFTVTSTGGVTFVSTVEADAATNLVNWNTISLSRIDSEVFLLSYQRGNITAEQYGLTFSVDSAGAITLPIDGPELMSISGNVGPAAHSAFIRSSLMINMTTSGLRSYPMTAAGVLSTGTWNSSHTTWALPAFPLTLDSGNGVLAFNHDSPTGDWILEAVVVDGTGGISRVSSTFINSNVIPTVSKMAFIGSRSLILLEDAASPARIRTYTADISGNLTTLNQMTSTGTLAGGQGPSWVHVSGNVMAVGTWRSSTNSYHIATISVVNQLTANSTVGINILVDWNNDGVFSSTEDISTDVLRFSWRRGREAEQDETPIGTGTLELKDPNADYNPLSTSSKWGSTFVRLNREVLARITFGTSTYNLFRGRIERITPQASPDVLRASISLVDGMAELGRKTVSFPNGGPTTAGAAFSSGDRPTLIAIGNGAVGAISRVLDEASWGSTRRQLTEVGSTLEHYWTYGKSAKNAIADLERHEFRGMVFIDRNGDVAFHSSTHTKGSTQLFSFNVQFQAWEHSFSARPIINSVAVTVHFREDATAMILGAVNPSGIANIVQGSTSVFVIPLSPVPVANVIVPAINANATGSAAAVGVGSNTSYGSSQVTVTGNILGASALQLRIANNTTETVAIFRAENAADTQTAFQVAGTFLNDFRFITTSINNASITEFSRRNKELELEFRDNAAEAANRATNIINYYGSMRADFTKMTLIGTDTTLIEQILARNINDRIRVTSTGLKITNKDYYIRSGEYELAPGNTAGLGLALGVVWTLEEAT